MIRKKNIQEFLTEKMKIKTEIENIKKRIVEHVDKLEETITESLNNVEEEQINNIKQFVDKLSEKERIVINNHDCYVK